MIEIKNVCKSFSSNQILHNLNLSISESIVGLAGPSGSGKSTLLRAIQSLESIDSGTIKISGTSAFMFQDFQLFPHMSVLDNLIYAPMIQQKNKKKPNDDCVNNENLCHKNNCNYTKDELIQKACKLLKQLGIEEKTNDFPNSLSGGQKQRVALARSLMIEPQILLCDEPTSGLDVATIDDVINLLKSIEKFGVVILIASHDLDFLTKIAHRIILLKNGKIAADVMPSKMSNPVAELKKFY